MRRIFTRIGTAFAVTAVVDLDAFRALVAQYMAGHDERPGAATTTDS